MDIQTDVHMYLSDQRGHSEVDYFRSLHVFNFGQYVAESRQPFGRLQVLNDNTLRAGRSVRMTVEQNTEVIFLPIVGGLEYKSTVATGFLEAGQSQILSLTAGMDYEISNPYETELINYLEIWITSDTSHFELQSSQVSFNLSTSNTLLPFTTPQHPYFRGFIGRYDGRSEATYQLSSPHNNAFVFVLRGAFEVQNRLLHERDGLALSHVQHQEIGFEALSNEAILLLLDISQEA